VNLLRMKLGVYQVEYTKALSYSPLKQAERRISRKGYFTDTGCFPLSIACGRDAGSRHKFTRRLGGRSPGGGVLVHSGERAIEV
jgi:hypothetical protein